MMRVLWARVGALLLVLGACGGGEEPADVVRDAAPPDLSTAVEVAAPPHGAGTEARTDDVLPLIGLVPSDDDAVTEALAAGLRYAFDAARRAGGPDIELIVAGRPERWASEAAAAVEMALDRGALAIVTPPERARAHVLAQFGTKARVPVVSTCPEASVTQAGSIWVVSVVAPGAPPEVTPEFARAFRTATGGAATPWAVAGNAAGRAAVAAIRRNGVRRDGFVAAAGR